MSRLIVVLSLIATMGLAAVGWTAASAAADDIPPGWERAPGGANSHGMGFCLSQEAQDPEGGLSSLGEEVREIAKSGPGAVPRALPEARYPVCGGPGSGE
jgi:hypothetical protein